MGWVGTPSHLSHCGRQRLAGRWHKAKAGRWAGKGTGKAQRAQAAQFLGSRQHRQQAGTSPIHSITIRQAGRWQAGVGVGVGRQGRQVCGRQVW